MTRSNEVPRPSEAHSREWRRRKLDEEIAEGYARMTAEERREYVQLAEEAQAGANEALRLLLGADDEGEWW